MYLVIKWKILKQQSLKYFSSKHVSSVNYYFYIINFQIASLLIFLVLVFGSCHIVRVFNNLYEVGPFISISDFLSFAYFQNYLTDFVQQMCKCQLHIGVFHPNICLIWLQMPCTILISIFFCSSLLLAFQSSCWDHDSKQLFSLPLIDFFLWIRSFWWPSMEPKSRPGLPGNIMQHMILVNSDFVTLWVYFPFQQGAIIWLLSLLYVIKQSMIMSFWRCCFWESSLWFGCLPH